MIQDENPKRAIGRRDLLKLAGAVPILLAPRNAAAAGKIRSKARIVIAGAGAAGLSAAARLSARLDGASITLIDAKKAHHYQPGFTLIAAGLVPPAYSISQTRDHLPAGVDLIEEAVAEFDPAGNAVVTASGRKVPYDFLIVATGLVLDYAAIVGMDLTAVGKNGLGSVYAGPEAAAATWREMSRFAETGGRGLFLRPATEMKCAGAPLKYAFLTDDMLRRKGKRDRAELTYAAHNTALFSVPIVSEKARMLFLNRGVKVVHNHVMTAIDPTRKIATFATPNGPAELPYDFINVIPPMRAPRAVRESPLPWQSGGFAADGLGGVMGSKNLKAIAVQGSRALDVADPKALWDKGTEVCKTAVTVPGGSVVPAASQSWSSAADPQSWWNARPGLKWGAADGAPARTP